MEEPPLFKITGSTIVLTYLGTEESFTSLQHIYRIPKGTISNTTIKQCTYM